MNQEQLKTYEAKRTIQERANYLLCLGVTAREDIVNLDLVYRAYVGCVSLPVTAYNKNVAIKKGERWLKDKTLGNTKIKTN